jgi:hypothetical protein
MKQHIEIAAKLYQCHKTAKKLFKEEFQDKIKFYKDRIFKVMELSKVDELKAVSILCELPSVKDEAFAIMMFLAAVVEILEPDTH